MCYNVYKDGTTGGDILNSQYPILSSLIATRGIKKNRMAETLNITAKSLSNKLAGKSPFTWNEVSLLQKNFFPDLGKDEIMLTENELTN